MNRIYNLLICDFDPLTMQECNERTIILSGPDAKDKFDKIHKSRFITIKCGEIKREEKQQ